MEEVFAVITSAVSPTLVVWICMVTKIFHIILSPYFECRKQHLHCRKNTLCQAYLFCLSFLWIMQNIFTDTFLHCEENKWQYCILVSYLFKETQLSVLSFVGDAYILKKWLSAIWNQTIWKYYCHSFHLMFLLLLI